jgi:tetratricopeptide (TPR) repeat protein
MKNPKQLGWGMTRTKVLLHMAEGYKGKGRFDQAIPVYHYLAGRAEDRHGPDSKEASEAYSRISKACEGAGDLEGAIEWQEKAARSMGEAFGAGSWEAGKEQRRAAALLGKASQWQRSLAWLKKAAEATRSHGDAGAALSLAQAAGDCERKLGNMTKALEWYREALDEAEQMHSEWKSSPAMAALANNAGLCLKSLGKASDAIGLYKQAWQIYSARPGSESDARMVAANIGSAHRALGDSDSALKWLMQAANGVKNPPAPILINIASAYLSKGDAESAIPWEEKALAAREGEYGADHISLAPVLAGLAEAWQKTGQNEKALAALKRAIPILERERGEKSPDLARMCLEAAEAANALGETRDALYYYKKAAESSPEARGGIYEKIGALYESKKDLKAAIDWYTKEPTASSALAASALCESEKRYEEALQWIEAAEALSGGGKGQGALLERKASLAYRVHDYQKAYELYIMALPKPRAGTAQEAAALRALSIAAEKIGRDEEAFGYCEEALKIRMQVLGERHKDTLASLNDMSYACHKRKDYQGALECDKKILDARSSEPNSEPAATAYSNIGVTYRMLGEYGLALKCHQKALELREAIFGVQSEEASWSQKRIADVFQDMGDLPNALEWRLKAAKNAKGMDKEAYEEIADLCHAMGDEEEATRYHIIASCF